MNIFIFDTNIKQNVQSYCNKHVIKMITEHCQMLANVFTLDELKDAPLTKLGKYRKHSYLHHPCSIWVKESYDNWYYLLQLTCALFSEYKYRYTKNKEGHKNNYNFLMWCIEKLHVVEHRIGHKGLTPFAQAMPDDVKNEDTITAYRNYFNKYKKHLAEWKNRVTPKWYK